MVKDIVNVKITSEVDTSDTLDYLGKFSNEKGSFAIAHNGGSNSYTWFNADNVEDMKQARQNYKRMMDCERGLWQPIGIRAVAVIRTGLQNQAWQHNELQSGGLWGIESDCGHDELKSVADDQLDELKDVLLTLGFSEQEITEAISKVDYSAI